MIKRILENEKYLGNDEYLSIISQEDFTLANAKKQKKSTKVCVISDELNIIRERTFCKECGKRLIRIGGNNRSEKWDCRNTACSRLGFRLTESESISKNVTWGKQKAYAEPVLAPKEESVIISDENLEGCVSEFEEENEESFEMSM